MDKHNHLSAFYKALHIQPGWQSLRCFYTIKLAPVTDFVIKLPFAQATISEHLRKLKQAGFVSVSEKGSSWNTG